MSVLWTAEDIWSVLGVRAAPGIAATGVSIDSRTLAPGDLFVALVTESGDGHRFVADAFARGAAAALVRDAVDDPRAIRVPDTLAALNDLARHARARSRARVVAITGSVGKTTTKEMLRTILSAQGRTHAAVASYNNQWGVPLTLARMPRDTEYAVIEIGMNQPGEILPLARLARPHVALITSVEKVHVGHLGSLEAVADEKAQLLRGLEENGIAVLPRDCAMLSRLVSAARDVRVTTFGTTQMADSRLLEAEGDAEGNDIVARIDGEAVAFRLPAPGAHMAINAVAALAGAHALGAKVAEGARALAGFAALSGRGLRQRVTISGGSILLLDESYNASGPSMRAALAVLKAQPARRRIAVLGDMRELGEFAEDEHVALRDPVEDAADVLFACGPHMRALYDAVDEDVRGAYAEASEGLIPFIVASLADGDAVLVKGSLGTRMKPIVDAIRAMGGVA